MFSFDPDKVDDNEIGHGSYGKVYAYKENPQEYERFVVKVAHTDDFSNFRGFIQEIVLGFSCDHANVLPIRGYYIDYDSKKKIWSVYIKLDRMKCSIRARINEQRRLNKHFSQKEIVNYLNEMSCGLEYLHNREIAHRDIKPENILISKNDEIKIADIGSGKFVGDERSRPMGSIAGTNCYIAPEILQREDSYLMKKDFFIADIWSLGVVVAEMCLLELEIVDATMSGKRNEENIIRKLKGLEGKIYDKALLDLIASIIRSNQEERKSLKYIQTTLKEKFRNDLKKRNESSRIIGTQNKDIFLGKKKIEEEKLDESVSINQIEKDLKSFKEKFKNSFKINFEGSFKAQIEPISFEKITENEVKELAQQLGSNLKSIQDLSFNFTNCRKITDNVVKELAQQIGSKLRNIQYLSLDFSCCYPISDNGVKELAQQIKSNLKNLHYLSLDFGYTDVTYEAVQFLRDSCKFIPGLDIKFGEYDDS